MAEAVAAAERNMEIMKQYFDELDNIAIFRRKEVDLTIIIIIPIILIYLMIRGIDKSIRTAICQQILA